MWTEVLQERGSKSGVGTVEFRTIIILTVFRLIEPPSFVRHHGFSHAPPRLHTRLCDGQALLPRPVSVSVARDVPRRVGRVGTSCRAGLMSVSPQKVLRRSQASGAGDGVGGRRWRLLFFNPNFKESCGCHVDFNALTLFQDFA